jgi:nitrate/nitrite-specific signal transduction histidine kinase
VRVALRCSASHCSIEIEDDGRGFCTQNIARDAQGLFGMRQRTQARGGKLDIHSAPGKGTRVRAVLPVEFPQARQSSFMRTSVEATHSSSDVHGVAGA